MTRDDFYQARSTEGIPFADTDGGHACTLRATDASSSLCDLRPIATLEMRGSDAAKFLQGYLTADLTELATERWLLGALCNVQGRMVGNFIVSGDAECVRMRMPGTTLPIVVSTLAKYAVFARAKLRDATDAWIGFGLIGASAVSAMHRLGFTTELRAGCRGIGADFEVLMRAHDRCDLWLAPTRAESVWRSLASELRLDGYARWLGEEVAAGVAWITDASTDAYLPQAFNLDACGGMSFTKGCYLGQEIVTRVQHRGSSKRRLYRLALPSETAYGTAVQLPDGREVGSVVQVGRTMTGSSEALAVLERTSTTQALQIGGEAVTVLNLPYASTD